MLVEILFVRHGLSCTNIIKSYLGILHQIKRTFYLDPPVSHFGAVDIESIPKSKFPKPDIILTSCLLRAIETASIVFPTQQKISVVPFVKEFGSTAGNMPSTINKQRVALLERFTKYHASSRVDYTLVQKTANNFIKEAYSSDFPMFVVWLEKMLPYLMTINNVSRQKKKIVITIVTHSNFMAKFLPSMLKDKPYHLGARKLMYNFDRSDLVLTENHTLSRQLYTYRPEENHRTAPAGAFKPGAPQKHNAGLFYTGFPVPSKEDFVEFEGDTNCKFKV
jgi:broad specificity phosphatase PhoE